MFRITPIYGSRWSEQGAAEEPSCTLVEYAGCRILWNVGWWSSGDEPLEASSNGDAMPVENDNNHNMNAFPAHLIPEHDCLIVTDSTLQCAGGLPLYHATYRKRLLNASLPCPPMYATFPTVKMGQMTLYDQHAAISLDGGTPPYSLADLDQVMADIVAIKYSQSIHVRPSTTLSGQASSGLTLTAHLAGHTVGACFVVLQRLQDETSVVLTNPTYHLAKERHLDSATLLKYGTTPDVLVTYPGGPAFRQMKALAHAKQGKKKPALPSQLVSQSERHLLESIMAVLRRDGNVLLPVDAAGRVLEVLLVLHQHWQRHQLSQTYTLVWLGPMVQPTAEWAACQTEWMSSNLFRQAAAGKGANYQQDNPLTAWSKTMQYCSSMAELKAVLEERDNNPCCVVASGLSLEGGLSRNVLLQWADNPDNAIIFTDSSQAYLRRPKTAPSSSKRMMEDKSERSVQAATRTSIIAAPTTSSAVAVDGTSETQPTQDDAGGDEADSGGLVGDAVAPGEVSEWTVAGQLLSAWAQAKAQEREMEDSVSIDVWVPQRAPLVGAELKAFLADEEAARRKEKLLEEKRLMLREVEMAKGQLHLGQEDVETAQPSAVTSSSAATEASQAASRTARPAARGRPRKKSRFDSSLFLKFSKPLHLMFEVHDEPVGLTQSQTVTKYGLGETDDKVLEDDYGIAINPEKFRDIVSGIDPSKIQGRIGEDVMRRGMGYGTDIKSAKKPKRTNAARVTDDEDQDEEDDQDEEEILEALDLSEGKGIVRGRGGRPPTKVFTIPRKLEVLAEVSYVPLEGRVDAKAARQSVRALQPRQLVVLGGPAGDEISDNLVDEVKLLADASVPTGNKDVPTPSNGETVELEVGHAAFSVRLIDVAYQPPDEKEAGAEPPEPVEPFQAKVGACTVSLLESVATGQKVAADGSIVLAPQLKSASMPSVYVSDGEVLLTDLRAELIALGMKADYSTHKGYAQLVVNGKIIIKKEQDGGMMNIEGPLTEDFYTVRSILTGQYVCL